MAPGGRDEGYDALGIPGSAIRVEEKIKVVQCSTANCILGHFIFTVDERRRHCLMKSSIFLLDKMQNANGPKVIFDTAKSELCHYFYHYGDIPLIQPMSPVEASTRFVCYWTTSVWHNSANEMTSDSELIIKRVFSAIALSCLIRCAISTNLVTRVLAQKNLKMKEMKSFQQRVK